MVINALSAVTPKLRECLQQIPGTASKISMQNSTVLGTDKILCRTLKLPGLPGNFLNITVNVRHLGLLPDSVCSSVCYMSVGLNRVTSVWAGWSIDLTTFKVFPISLGGLFGFFSLMMASFTCINIFGHILRVLVQTSFNLNTWNQLQIVCLLNLSRNNKLAWPETLSQLYS